MRLIFEELLRQWPSISMRLQGLPAKAIEALRNPARDPRLTAIIVVLGVACLLLLSTFIELLMAVLIPEKKKQATAPVMAPVMAVDVEAPAEPAKSPKKRRRPLTVAERSGLAVFIVGSVFLAAVIGSSQQRFCSSCHAMEKADSTWKQSVHKNVSCLECHSKPGFFGYAMGKLDLARMAVAQVGEVKTPIRGRLEEGGCPSCHAKIYGETVVSGSIRVSHKEFLDTGYRCDDCHGTTAHGGGAAGATYPTMDKCATCHDGKRASVECKTCHAVDVGVAVRRAKAEYPKASLPSGTCYGCHEPQKCRPCHGGIDMPHPPGWTNKALHAKSGAFEKKESCQKCHNGEAFCNECHRFPGHPADWKNGHKTSRSAENSCMSCHQVEMSPIFCNLCHDESERLGEPPGSGASKTQ